MVKKGKAVEVAHEPTVQEATESLMIEALDLKDRLNDKVRDADYDPNFHLARRYKEIKTELATIVAEEKVPVEDLGKGKCIRLGGLKFVSRLQEGRKSLDQDKLKEGLLGLGLSIETMNTTLAWATKEGVPFWVNEIGTDKD